jgi:DNA-binding transcriptional ArsR family regulator
MRRREGTGLTEQLLVLPGDVPVVMPGLPATLAITTVEQFKAISDPFRSRMLGIIQQQPATAKQIADRLQATPGAIGHHLHVLEAAGLAQIVALRQQRGIVAKYYTRTARIFVFDLPPEIAGSRAVGVDMLTMARDELAEAAATMPEDVCLTTSFPHVRLTPERAETYRKRFNALIDELLDEPQDSAGDVYAACLAFFVAPAYLQGTAVPAGEEAEGG